MPTEPRFTRAADLAVALASDAEAEALIRELRAHGYRVEAVVGQDAVGRLLARARDSLALIAVRGYHGGRNLMSEMNAFGPLAP